MEAEFLCPNTDHAPGIQNQYANHDKIEHSLGAESESFLDEPVNQNARTLSCDPDDVQVSQGQGVICNNRVLKCGNYGDRGIEGIT